MTLTAGALDYRSPRTSGSSPLADASGPNGVGSPGTLLDLGGSYELVVPVRFTFQRTVAGQNSTLTLAGTLVGFATPHVQITLAGGVLQAVADNTGATITLDHSGSATVLQGRQFPDSAIEQIAISAGDADKTVNIVAAARPVTLNAGGGNTVVHLGGGRGGLAAFTSSVYVYTIPVLPLAPCVKVKADDKDCGGIDHYSLTVTGTTYNIYKNPSVLGFSFSTIGLCEVDFIAGHNSSDTVDILSTPAGVLTTVDTAANDAVNVGNPAHGVQDILGPVYLNNVNTAYGGPFQSNLRVDDSGDLAGQAATLSVTGPLGQIAGLAPALISYTSASLSALTVTTGSGNDAIFAASTAVGVPVTLFNSGGQDTLAGASSNDQFWALTGLDTGWLSGAGFGSNIRFWTYQNLAGNAANDTFVFWDGAGVSGTIDGGGGVNALDYTAYSTTVIVDLPLGQATGVFGFNPNGIANIQNVTGGFGGPEWGPGAPYNVLVGNGGNVLTGGDGRRNLLIAGASASTLQGGNADDVLVGGTTAWDANLFALQQIMLEWTQHAPDDYNTRCNDLQYGGGLNGPFILDATTVFDNGGGNVLTGHNGGPTELNLYYGTAADLAASDGNFPTEVGVVV
jgi:hypothetical protein